MCGIIGTVGEREAAPVVLNALKRLEYRGYDSAGMAVSVNSHIEIRKGCGKLDEVEETCHMGDLPGSTGIGHVRWATHGGVTDANAHPHLDCTGTIAVVHNGIIENYRELKEYLAPRHTFVSETDTEVIAHLIEEELFPVAHPELDPDFSLASDHSGESRNLSPFPHTGESRYPDGGRVGHSLSRLAPVGRDASEGVTPGGAEAGHLNIGNTGSISLELAVHRAVKKLRGSYAILVISSEEPGKIVAARRDSPLIIGMGEKNGFLASDALCFLDYTDQAVYVEDGETVVLSSRHCEPIQAVGHYPVKSMNRCSEGALHSEASGISGCNPSCNCESPETSDYKHPRHCEHLTTRPSRSDYNSVGTLGVSLGAPPKQSKAAGMITGEQSKRESTQSGEAGHSPVASIPYSLRILDSKFQEVRRQPVKLDYRPEEATRQGHKYYMYKEILEQPQALRRAVRQDKQQLQGMAIGILRARNTILTACGTSRHAALVGRYAFSKLAGKFSEVVMASEFQYFADSLDKNTLVIAVSQSGETADVMQGVRKARENRAQVFSLVNTPGSTLARFSDSVLHLQCGPEIAVAATKSFVSQLAVFYLLAYAMDNRLDEGIEKIVPLSDLIEENLKYHHPGLAALAGKLKDKKDFYYLGRGINFAIAGEGALKMKEISYVHAEGMPAGELKHGTLALIEPGTPVIAVCPGDYTFDEMMSNIIEARARGAYVIGVSDRTHPVFDEWVRIPTVEEIFYPLVSVIPLQLFAYHSAVVRGYDPDKPRNLAKSVTVK